MPPPTFRTDSSQSSQSLINGFSMRGLILFDLDGTLIDTARDLVAAVNYLRRLDGLDEMSFLHLREFAGKGAGGLIREALGIEKDNPRYPELEKTFLDYYEHHSRSTSGLFDGISELITAITQKGLSWGIVTNKRYYLAKPIVDTFFSTLPAFCTLVGGDTTAHTKPHPDSLMHAMNEAGFTREETVYVGDDARDILAAHNAGIKGIVASWGYTGGALAPLSWNADYIARNPADILVAAQSFIVNKP